LVERFRRLADADASVLDEVGVAALLADAAGL
jgi:hypothetical protein